MPIIKNTPESKKILKGSTRIRTKDEAGKLVVTKSREKDRPYLGAELEVCPSDFVEFAIRIPNQQTKALEPFSFEERPYLLPVYNTTSPRVLLKCGRQVEKSTYLGNRLLALTCIQPSFTALYVSPTNQQTKTFSNDRIKEPLETSPRLKAWMDDKLAQNVFQKKFINRSQIVMRYAFLNADRVRGIPADIVCIDEIQDIHTDSLPVIEECISHSAFKFKLYAGTPKSLDNTIEGLWVEDSTQNEWAVPCFRCGGGDVNYWNILDEENIGPESLVCDRCKKPLDPMADGAQWASMNPYPRVPYPLDGYRVPQLMVPWLDWEDILTKQISYSRAKFYNEVLGMSYDSGTRPLTRQDVVDNCDPTLTLAEDSAQKSRLAVHQNQLFMGIDWGTGEQTYTVVLIGGYINGAFTIIYAKRFEGVLTEPLKQLDYIYDLVKKWGVSLIGCDYGGGFDRNDAMIRRFGPTRVFKFQYSTISAGKVRWEPGLSRFLLNRSEIMSDVFNAIRRRNIFKFPRWEDWERPYGADMLNIFSEYSEERRMNEYKKSKGVTDDTFHALVLCFMTSLLRVPRPDVISSQRDK